jgi:rhodanese-related sulfurtransferase
LLFSFITFFCQATNQNVENSTSVISSSEVKTYLDSDKDILIHDTRTILEYINFLAYISEEILHTLQKIEDWILEFDSLKDSRNVIACVSGNRNSFAIKYPIDNRYTKVVNFGGRIRSWNALDYP